MEPLKIGITGVRGVVGQTLTPELVVRFAEAFGSYLDGGRILVCRIDALSHCINTLPYSATFLRHRGTNISGNNRSVSTNGCNFSKTGGVNPPAKPPRQTTG